MTTFKNHQNYFEIVVQYNLIPSGLQYATVYMAYKCVAIGFQKNMNLKVCVVLPHSFFLTDTLESPWWATQLPETVS